MGDDVAAPGAIGQYRVAFRDSLTETLEQRKGAPKASSATLQMIFSERVIRANPRDDRMITDVVRRYETVRVLPAPPTRQAKPYVPLEGMTLWFQQRPGVSIYPLVLDLTPSRPLREEDYGRAMALYYQVNMTQLAFLLPDLPTRTGESWQIPKSGAQALLGKPVAGGGGLVGKLLEVKADPKGGPSIAIFSVTGHTRTDEGDMAVNAMVEFSFAPPAPAGPAAAAKEAEPADAARRNVIDARGGIVRIRSAQTYSGPRPDTDPTCAACG